MENDYQKYSPETEELLDKLGIAYVWRDSCVNVLVEVKQCMRNDFYSYYPVLEYFSACRGIQKLWKECQYQRESLLLDKYFLKYKEIEQSINQNLTNNNKYNANKTGSIKNAFTI